MKKLGFWSIVLLTINSIVGAGIFLSTGSVVSMSGTNAPLVYGFAACFAAILAITFASAAKYVSKSGAAYAYAKVAFGDNVGFYVGITRFIASSIAWGVMATGVVKTIISILKGNSNSFFSITIGFFILMLSLLIINLMGQKAFEIINNFSTIGKLLALITVIITGIIIVINTDVNRFQEINCIVSSNINLSTWVMAVIAAFYAFTGFESVASGSEDMEKPEKNLPKAIPLAVVAIALIYIGIILISMMINPEAIVKTKEVVALVAVFKMPLIKNIVLYGSLISMFGINVAASFSTPRILEAISKEKQISPWFKKRTKNNFPLRAFIVTIIIASILPMAFQYNMTNIIVLSSISRFIQFLIVPIGIIMFYYEKNVGHVLKNVRKNWITDVLIPFFSLILTIFLLIEFDWKGQFSTELHGKTQLNIYAIVAMIIGYILLPILLFIINKKNKHEEI